MDILQALGQGFASAITLAHLGWALAGVTLGTAVGVLPGIGPALTVALLLPVTFNLEPTSAFIMFAGIYSGAMYGGSTTSILLNTPGETSSIVTAIDGHMMARQGRGAAALTTAAIGSFVAGTLATIALTFFAPVLASFALRFGPAEYFALTVLAFTTVSVLLGASVLRGLFSLFMGLALGLIGIDQLTGEARLSFGIPQLLDGIDVVILVIGLFAVGETIYQAWRHGRDEVEILTLHDFTGMSRDDWKRSWKPWLRGTAIGFPLGVLPCGGRGDPDVSLVHGREAAERPSRAVRARRDRGRGRPRSREQRGRRGRSRSAPHAGDSFVGDRRDHARRLPAVRTAAGPAAVLLASRSRLDADCEPLHRQRDAAGAEPAARQRVGPDHAGAATVVVWRDYGPGIDRSVQPQPLGARSRRAVYRWSGRLRDAPARRFRSCPRSSASFWVRCRSSSSAAPWPSAKETSPCF